MAFEPKEDPEIVWRRLIRLRCEGWAMVYGERPRVGGVGLVSPWPPFHAMAQPAAFGPPLPSKIARAGDL